MVTVKNALILSESDQKYWSSLPVEESAFRKLAIQFRASTHATDLVRFKVVVRGKNGLFSVLSI